MNATLEEVRRRYKREWTDVKAQRDSDLLYAIQTKTRLPPDYWKAEYAAREKLRIATAILEAYRG